MSSFEKYFKSKEKEFYDVSLLSHKKFVYNVLLSNLGVKVNFSGSFPKIHEQDCLVEFSLFCEKILKKLVSFTQFKVISAEEVSLVLKNSL